MKDDLEYLNQDKKEISFTAASRMVMINKTIDWNAEEVKEYIKQMSKAGLKAAKAGRRLSKALKKFSKACEFKIGAFNDNHSN